MYCPQTGCGAACSDDYAPKSLNDRFTMQNNALLTMFVGFAWNSAAQALAGRPPSQNFAISPAVKPFGSAERWL